mmetsp:Transcript_53919/g.136203  ORF Transcript_53919/g.136203 Transcript_53919/m.136203 type:complete len:99 (-) Transcript_53919:233-529(-)
MFAEWGSIPHCEFFCIASCAHARRTRRCLVSMDREFMCKLGHAAAIGPQPRAKHSKRRASDGCERCAIGFHWLDWYVQKSLVFVTLGGAGKAIHGHML